MSVTNEDLRNDITGLKTEMRQVRDTLGDMKTSADGQAERRSVDRDKVTAIYAGLSVLRLLVLLVATWVGGACVWTFSKLTDAINTDIAQNLRLSQIETEDKVRDTRLQNLERSQFATSVKEK